MMSAEQNDLITKVGPKTPGGKSDASLLATGGAG